MGLERIKQLGTKMAEEYHKEDLKFRQTHWSVKVAGILSTAALAACGTAPKVAPTSPENPGGQGNSPFEVTKIPLDHSNPLQKVVEDLSTSEAQSAYILDAKAVDAGSYRLDTSRPNASDISVSVFGTPNGNYACFQEPSTVEPELAKNDVKYSTLPDTSVAVCGPIKAEIEINDGVILTTTSMEVGGDNYPFLYNNYGKVDASKSQDEQDQEARQRIKNGNVQGYQVADILRFENPPASIAWILDPQQSAANIENNLITDLLSSDASIVHAQEATNVPTEPAAVSPTETQQPAATAQPTETQQAVQETKVFTLTDGTSLEMPEFATAEDVAKYVEANAHWKTGGRNSVTTSWGDKLINARAIGSKLQKVPGFGEVFDKAMFTFPATGDTYFTLSTRKADGGTIIEYENQKGEYSVLFVPIDTETFDQQFEQLSPSFQPPQQ